MSNIIQGVKVDGTIYKYDYESLENLPDPELPSSTASDEGKALVINSTGEPAWSELPSGLPYYSSVDSGKTLMINSNGSPEWGLPEWIDMLPNYGCIGDGGSKALMVVSESGDIDLVWHTIMPTIESQDYGKVLVVSSIGELIWENINEVPEASSLDEGKILMVNSTGEPVWNDPNRGVPDSDGSDEGKALVVASNGMPIWKTIIPYSNSGDYGKVLMVNDSYGDVAWCNLLPTHDTSYEGSDAGKVLTVATNGSLTWEEGGSGGLPLPDGSPDEGAVLISSGCGNLAWGNPFPYHDSSDVGKVLSIDSDGELVWADPNNLPADATDS